ncbi:DUF1269 domain-containing protein [Halomonas urumqiensis]|uniref:DUF1269 domain-containing protein n=1 Tax=Halomonas urumqiensis TaxID=1684789 RepID=A0A2N7UDL5_9GAMM|nr:DUF1269 domain-containing protein [Halomonas urumqiensis]PMR78481.1 DUF1269 domain-containing protein [Halomonas urumqiensis]PTB03626.1 DUF1269 domain-containing protein [Halomonas urumqiensis]GHE20163.1 hypothetical protein GCM10017767_06840 [Halomonas urumqiensis]
MQRLYFLTPDLDTTVSIAHELNDLGLSKREVHVTGRDWQHLEERGVNNATLRQTSDVVHAAWRGVKFGVPLGLLLGVVVYYVLGEGLGSMGIAGVIIGMGVFGGLFGVWTSTMVGVSVHDVKVDKYEDEIEEGAFLMMVDVANQREDEVYSVIHRHHPEVIIDKVSREELKHHSGTGA